MTKRRGCLPRKDWRSLAGVLRGIAAIIAAIAGLIEALRRIF